MIDRKKVPLTWKKQIAPIQEKISLAIKELPENQEIQSFIEGRTLNYFDCIKIMELLESVAHEDTSKNLFGSYVSKKMQDWDKIVQMYKRDNVYLGELASMLISLANFEIPSHKKKIEQSQKQISDLNRKEKDWEKNVKTYEKRYERLCEEYSIEGKDVRNELLDLVLKLPSLLDHVASLVQQKEIEDSIHIYEAFIGYILGSQEEELETDSSLPTLKRIYRDGNSIEKKKDSEEIEEEKRDEVPLEVDWTVIEEKVSSQETIQEPTIQWDIETEVSASEGPQIVWDIDTFEVDNNAIEVVESMDGSLESTKIEAPKERETVLSDTQTRNLLMDDLLELKCFLQQRKEEMESTDSSMAINLFAKAPKSVQELDRSKIETCLNAVNKIVDSLEESQLRSILEIKNSPRYVDRLCASFQHLIECINKSKESISYAERKKESLQNLVYETAPQLQSVIKKTKELKLNLEADLSKHYSGRPVNIIGEINTILKKAL